MGGGREIIFEITQIGETQRVVAVDAASGTEVVIQAPAGAARADVQALAMRKLERALQRQGEHGAAGGASPGGARLDRRGGKLV